MIPIKLSAASIVATLGLAFSASAFALPAMDVRIEDLMQQAGDVKKSLNLNQNQQTLWQQVESKMRAILSIRQTRRERLQADLKLRLDDSKAELREIAAKMDAEGDLTNQENRQLRELWLTVNDALNDAQRQTILAVLSDQLQRMPDFGQGTKGHKADGEMPPRGKGHQKPGGMGGGFP